MMQTVHSVNHQLPPPFPASAHRTASGRRLLAIALTMAVCVFAFATAAFFVSYQRVDSSSATHPNTQLSVDLYLYQTCASDDWLCTGYDRTTATQSGDLCALDIETWDNNEVLLVSSTFCRLQPRALAAGAVAYSFAMLATLLLPLSLFCLRSRRVLGRLLLVLGLFTFIAFVASVSTAAHWQMATDGLFDDIPAATAATTFSLRGAGIPLMIVAAGFEAGLTFVLLFLARGILKRKMHMYRGLDSDGRPVQEWGDGLFSCMDDPGSFFLSICFPCLPIGENYRDGGFGDCGTGCVLSCLAGLFALLPCMLCWMRATLYRRFGVASTIPCAEATGICFCPACAVAQDRRALVALADRVQHAPLIAAPPVPGAYGTTTTTTTTTVSDMPPAYSFSVAEHPPLSPQPYPQAMSTASGGQRPILFDPYTGRRYTDEEVAMATAMHASAASYSDAAASGGSKC